MKDLTQKLSTQLYFELKMAPTPSIFKNIFLQKIISFRVYCISFCSQVNCSWMIVKNAKSRSLPCSQAARFLIWKLKSCSLEDHNFAFLKVIQKQFTLEQKLIKWTLDHIIFWWKNYWYFFVATKLSKWRPFWVQNTMGCGALNFTATFFFKNLKLQEKYSW